ncbi:glutamate synthase [NADPH] small chain [Vibrio ponticus]|nr:glutamate synthase [NADPH] small chain [Vibrio ponticus]
MDNLVAVSAAILYILAIATIIPGLVHQTGIRAKTVLVSAILALVFHAWSLADLILSGSGKTSAFLMWRL